MYTWLKGPVHFSLLAFVRGRLRLFVELRGHVYASVASCRMRAIVAVLSHVVACSGGKVVVTPDGSAALGTRFVCENDRMSRGQC